MIWYIEAYEMNSLGRLVGRSESHFASQRIV